jgi:16S rRNA (cytosine967-C5)-methyltransferase
MTQRSRVKPTARSVAAQVLVRVARDEAFASAALDAELERAVQLGPADRRLTTELVYGVLRCEGFLDERLARCMTHGKGKLDHETRANLRIAAYQLACLERIPAFAAVSEAVKLVRDRRGPGLASFANAVLRRLAGEVEHHGRVTIRTAIEASLPADVINRVADALGGRDEALAMLTAGPFPPPTGLRVHAGQEREAWQTRILAAAPHAAVTLGSTSPVCVNVMGGGNPQALPGCGVAWSVQEEGSQVLALSLGVRPGERVLDACAGRGTKTLLLGERAGPHGTIDASDLHASKLEILRARASELGTPLGATFAVDWTVGPGDTGADYDRVLIDAPCSGTGTLRRRPELLHRALPEVLAQIKEVQVALLCEASKRCRPGGQVVYAVCSVLREEAEDVIDAAQRRGAEVTAAPFGDPTDLAVLRGRSTVRLLPHVHGTDGYFMASFRRKTKG